ncbi:periplasmic heavy metal sensor [Mucilaginibacter achroorhodeus]|uniref:Periplasmic heavy metal sensor n=2 Tax=Mucilaginibacter achroorhodeus TaxID=2599294 RepID=A0A563U3N9_9SPHI|nr:periplasmic heavy metal sensor [Mucilaginibacter achroorhodeus]
MPAIFIILSFKTKNIEMKKIMMICLLVLGVSAVSHAQGRMRMSPEERVKQMKEKLNLTDDQTTKITAIYQAQAKSMDSLRNAGGDMRSQMRPMMQATNDKVKAILTPEQAAAWQKEMDERRARMQNGGGQSN